MNEFDQTMKHILPARYYVRYADDFVLMSRDKGELEIWLEMIGRYLGGRLALDLHPQKVSIETLASGVDFLGWVHYPDHRVLRPTTRRRIMRNVAGGAGEQALASYMGLLEYGRTRRLADEVNNAAWLTGVF